MRPSYSHYVIAVPAAQQSAANAAAAGLDRESTEVFCVPLSADGGASLTHYGCCTALRPDTAATTAGLASFLGGSQAACVPAGDPGPDGALLSLGLVPFLEEG